jgi:hypothetical protein
MTNGLFDFTAGISPIAREVERTTDSQKRETRLGGRVVSLMMLSAVTAGFGYAASIAYHAARDCYVAPAILSPESDLVIANKLKLSELAEEQARSLATVEGIDANVSADEKGIARLESLRGKLVNAGRWTKQTTASKASSRAAALGTIARQRNVLATMLKQQRSLTAMAHSDVDSGVISRSDYAREAQALNEIELAQLSNEKAEVESAAAFSEAKLEERALSQTDGAAPMPELLAQEGEVIRVELEILHLDSDRRSKTAERAAIISRVAKIEELSEELRRRPLYRAAEGSLDVAFVPYTQLDSVESGAAVYTCVWGLFKCAQVGTVTEVVPGEAISSDPWGTTARGQYAVLNLWDRTSARSKTLRVRRETPPSTKGF